MPSVISISESVKPILFKVAKNIRALRKQHKYSQEYLAELIDRTREHINRLEKGKETIGFPTFIRLAQIFNVSLDELAGYHVDNKSSN